MYLKHIDLTGKCGSCCHFKPIEDTATGECLQNPYNDSIVHDPKHPHWIVQRSRIKCPLYNAKPQTNADRIRAMSDEDLEDFLLTEEWMCDTYISCSECPLRGEKGCISILEWLKQPAEVDHG